MDYPAVQMMKAGVCEKTSLRKGTWSPEEDRKLKDYVNRYGIWNWAQMPKPAGLLRSGKSCRLRWMNYLKPGVKLGNFTQEEDEIIFKLHEQLGNRWSIIASRLPGRTDNEIKNYWHTRMKKRLKNKQVLTQTATIKNNQKNPSEDFSSVSSQLSTEDISSSSSNTSDEICERQTKSENIGSSEKYGKLQSSVGQTFPILESFGMVEGNGTTDPGFVVPTSPVVISDEELQSLLEKTILPMEGLDMGEGAGATDTGFVVSNSQGRFSDGELQALLDQPFPIETGLDMVEGYAATDPGFMVSTSQEWGLQEDTYRCASYYDGGNDFWPYFLMEP